MHTGFDFRFSASRAKSLVTLAVLAVTASNALAFPAPVQGNPTASSTTIPIDYTRTLIYSQTLNFSTTTPTTTYPDVYWFKYTSNGQSIVKFDTLGSNFGTNGPGNPSSGGAVLGAYNQSQIAVYRADGGLQAISKGTVDLQGNPIPIYPNYATSDPSNRLWYTPQGLSELYFQPNAPTNPHWSASPTDSTPYTGWSAPGNEGNGQKYYAPYYYTSLNEYQVWNTALSSIVLDNSGNAVINPSTGQPYKQPGWRY